MSALGFDKARIEVATASYERVHGIYLNHPSMEDITGVTSLRHCCTLLEVQKRHEMNARSPSVAVRDGANFGIS